MTKPLHILHTESSKGWGGQEIRIIKEALCLRKKGHRLSFIAKPDAKILEQAKHHDFDTFALPMKNATDIRSLFKIRKIIDQIKPDIVNTHSGHDSILAGIAAKTSRHRPLIIRTRHLLLPITSKFTYTTLPDHILTDGEATKRTLIAQGIPENHITSIVTGFDPDIFNPDHQSKDFIRQQLGISPETPLIGCMAILRHKKGHRYLINAMPEILKHLPDTHLAIVGDGPQKEALEALIAEKQLSHRIHLLGFLPAETVLGSFDVMALPTLEEAFGGALVEAQAMGIPVVSTTVGGVPEAVSHTLTGILVPPANSDALAATIVDLLKDAEKRQQMGHAARKNALEKFTVETMGNTLIACYHNLLEKHSKR